MTRVRIKSGDTVIVLTGKDAGKKGKVLQVFPDQRKVVVEGVNAMIKNVRAKRAKEKGQKVQFHGPIHVSNVMFVDPKSGQPTRLGAMTVGDKKVRRAIRTNQTIS
jgi:large subunit ribosomal protein L24